MASVGQVYFDGNGIHDNGTNKWPYEIDDETIVITMGDGSRLEIPYSASSDEIVLGEGSYLALSRVGEEIQGYWTATTHSDFTGGDSKYYLLVDHGMLKMEYASEAYGGEEGEYYYFAPEQGSYTLEIGRFNTDMRHGNTWFFNIIDGKPVILHYNIVKENINIVN